MSELTQSTASATSPNISIVIDSGREFELEEKIAELQAEMLKYGEVKPTYLELVETLNGAVAKIAEYRNVMEMVHEFFKKESELEGLRFRGWEVLEELEKALAA